MSELELLALLKQFGPFVILLGFFIYRDKQREERLGARLDMMQDRFANTMETVVKDNTKAQEAVALATNSQTRILERLVDEVRSIPCVFGERKAVRDGGNQRNP